MMIIFCIVLLFTIGRCADNQSFELKTVCVREDVTLTCSRQIGLSGILLWKRLVAGNFPEILGATYTFDNGNVNKTPRITAKQQPGTFVLHISRTKRSDTAFYYCEQVVELKTTFLNKTFLRVKEPDITPVTQDLPSDPVHPEDFVTFQCSVLSDSQKKTCPEEHSVFWFSLFYAHGNSGDECEKSPEPHCSQKCVYSFSKNVSSSDAGTYFCAVASCGEILFGNGTKLDTEAATMSFGDCQSANTILCLLCAALAITLIVIALLIYTIKKKKCNCCNADATLQMNPVTTTGDQQSLLTDEDLLVYSEANFTRGKAGRSVRRGANSVEGESIYADVKVLG